MMAVLTAPASIRNPTTTMKAWNRSLSGRGPTRYIEMPLMRLSKYCGQTLRFGLRKYRHPAPKYQQHHHRRRHVHYLQRVVRRLVDALRVTPPEIDCDEDGYPCGAEIDRLF